MSKDNIQWGNQTIGDLSHEDILNPKVNIKLANKAKAKDPKWLESMAESNRKSEVRAKRAASMPDQSGQNNPFYGKTHSEEFINKHAAHLSEKYSGDGNPFYGKRHDENAIAKMRKPRSNTANMRGPRQQKTCPHCGHVGAGGNMSRYHFDNCKQKGL